MRKLAVIALATVAALAVPATAGAVEVATAGYVQTQLVRHWGTPDGRKVRSAVCTPRNRFSVHRTRIFAASWNCIEVDALSRVLWVHAKVANNAGLSRVSEYRCSARYSRYRCP